MVKKVELKWYDIMVIAMTIFALIMILWRVLGNSPSDLNVFMPLLLAIAGQVYWLNREIGEFKAKTAHGFQEMKNDFKNMQKDIKLLVKRRK